MEPMLILGTYVFGINTAAFQELNRDTEWRWPAQDVFGGPQVLQFTGWGSETITLPGIIFPEYWGGTGQVDELRAMADEGLPQVLIDGRGNVLGEWVIEKVTERQSTFAAAGAPRRQEFTVTLKRYGDGDTAQADTVGGLVDAVATIGGLPSAPVASGLAALAGAAGSLARNVASAAGQLSSGLSAAASSIAGLGGSIGPPLASIQSALGRGLVVADNVKTLGNSAGTLLGAAPTLSSVGISMSSITVATPDLLAQAVGVSSGLRGALTTMQAAEATAEAIDAVNAAMGTAGRLAALVSSSHHAANSILAEASA